MRSTKEIKFRDRFGSLVGRKNWMTFIIRKEHDIPVGMPAYCVSVCSENGEVRFSTVCHQYFHLDEAKKFCQEIADGKLSLSELSAQYDAEDEAERHAVRREIRKKADAFAARLAALDLSCRDFLELEVTYSGLGEVGREIMLELMREEGESRGMSPPCGSHPVG